MILTSADEELLHDMKIAAPLPAQDVLLTDALLRADALIERLNVALEIERERVESWKLRSQVLAWIIAAAVAGGVGHWFLGLGIADKFLAGGLGFIGAGAWFARWCFLKAEQ